MTQPIDPSTAPKAIEAGQTMVAGKTYRFRRDGDQFFVTEEDASAGTRRGFRLVMMTGSHHMHVFWYDSGVEKSPSMLPIVYLLDQQRWIPRGSAFLRTPGNTYEAEQGRWNSTCCLCHSTHPRPHVSADRSFANGWQTEVSEFGISCEACHGPGQGHVLIHQASNKQAAATGSTQLRDRIVDPMDLDSDLQSEMCARCHSVGFAKNEREYMRRGLDYRPGQSIEDSRRYQIVRASPGHVNDPALAHWLQVTGADPSNSFWPDGQMRGTGRAYSGMIESPCFKSGDMTCLSCHTMHQQDRSLQEEWRDDQLRPGMRGDQACLQCHQEYEQLGSKHTHHPVESTGSRCVNCHMPHTVYGLLKTVRSHTISSPSVQTVIDTTRPSACNLCHLDQTLQETSRHLAEWYGHQQPQLTDEEKTIALSVLQLLKGDAPQRAIQVAAMERTEARDASGTEWLELYLLVGMLDRYDAIRFIAERAYKSLPDSKPIEFDFVAPPSVRSQIITERLDEYCEEAILTRDARVLVDKQGKVDREWLHRLLEDRNERPVNIQE
ncbi:cytochrome c3 family protein [Stieleria neptunia]|nr:hypothetical protein [Stieleria neptunia]